MFEFHQDQEEQRRREVQQLSVRKKEQYVSPTLWTQVVVQLFVFLSYRRHTDISDDVFVLLHVLT